MSAVRRGLHRQGVLLNPVVTPDEFWYVEEEEDYADALRAHGCDEEFIEQMLYADRLRALGCGEDYIEQVLSALRARPGLRPPLLVVVGQERS